MCIMNALSSVGDLIEDSWANGTTRRGNTGVATPELRLVAELKADIECNCKNPARNEERI
jgi:hypothetical protein